MNRVSSRWGLGEQGDGGVDPENTATTSMKSWSSCVAAQPSEMPVLPWIRLRLLTDAFVGVPDGCLPLSGGDRPDHRTTRSSQRRKRLGVDEAEGAIYDPTTVGLVASERIYEIGDASCGAAGTGIMIVLQTIRLARANLSNDPSSFNLHRTEERTRNFEITCFGVQVVQRRRRMVRCQIACLKLSRCGM